MSSKFCIAYTTAVFNRDHPTIYQARTFDNFHAAAVYAVKEVESINDKTWANYEIQFIEKV